MSISCAATALGSMSGLRGLELPHEGCRKGEAFLRGMQKEDGGQILVVTRDILIG